MGGRKWVWKIAIGETGANSYKFFRDFCYAGIVYMYVEIILMHNVNDIIGF
jgi:ABC-type arginine/histidine transport system permease subunit